MTAQGGWALVTAGAQGLGLALSTYLLEQGRSVIVHYRSSAQGAQALQTRFGQERVLTLQADLLHATERERLIEAAKAKDLRVLINNLGVYPEVDLMDTDLALWEQTFTLTCTAAFHLISALHPKLAQGDGARIINIGDSGLGRLGAKPQATPYHVGKQGLFVLNQTFAQKLMPDITVNMISPGWLENSVGDQTPKLPAGRRGRFEDITGALAYLLSPAADYVSGANIVVSGGWNL